jgi:ribosomal protein S18 acetylase RimI-like enzyme
LLVADAKVTLRSVRPDEGEFLFRVYASTRVAELAPVPWKAEQKDAFLRQQFQAQDAEYRGAYPQAGFDVIEIDGAPAGRLYVDRGSDDIRVIDIALLPEYRGRGVGSALLQSLLDEAAEARKRVSIHVELNNPARRLYERLGFQPVATRGIYLLMEATP